MAGTSSRNLAFWALVAHRHHEGHERLERDAGQVVDNLADLDALLLLDGLEASAVREGVPER